jgi:hypothetical protein
MHGDARSELYKASVHHCVSSVPVLFCLNRGFRGFYGLRGSSTERFYID